MDTGATQTQNQNHAVPLAYSCHAEIKEPLRVHGGKAFFITCDKCALGGVGKSEEVMTIGLLYKHGNGEDLT